MNIDPATKPITQSREAATRRLCAAERCSPFTGAFSDALFSSAAPSGHRFHNPFGRLLAASVLLAGLCGGCVNPPKSIYNPDVEQAKADGDAPDKLELPIKEKAKVNLATAQMMDRDGRIPEAIALYERTRAINPSHGHVCRRLAVLYDRQGNFVKANEEYEKALAMFPQDAAILNDAGYCHYLQRNFALAENYLRQSVEIQPDNKRAWTNLGMTLALRERGDEALAAFLHAVAEPQARCQLAFAYMMAGKRQEAMDEYRKALQLAPDLDLARHALARLENPSPTSAETKTQLPPADRNVSQARPATESESLTSRNPSPEAKRTGGFATQRDQ